MGTFSCSVAQEGFYAGPVYRLGSDAPSRDCGGTDAAAELRRFRRASDSLAQEVEESAAGEKNRDILETAARILADEAFTDEVERGVTEQGLDAAAAVRAAGEALCTRFEGVASEYLRSRREDVRGVASRLARVLEGSSGVAEGTFAVCGQEISPAELAAFDEGSIGALLSVGGSVSSHASILAGNLGVPYLYGNPEAVEEAGRAAFVVIDSSTATVTCDPDPGARAAAEKRMACELEERSARRARELAGEVIASCRTRVCANIEGPKDIDALLASGADGVGLLRTELLFMDRDEAPGEEEQHEAYRSVLEAMGEREVVIRTMDLGSDKAVPWLDLPREANPALGLRGVRVSLENGDVFTTQLRALLRAATAGNLKVMFPMVASAWEVDEILAKVRQTADELAHEGVPHAVPELGIMVETPAAAVCAGELARRVAFFSVGTNDLTQYTLAVDREAIGLERYSDPRHEAVFRLIDMTVRGGHGFGVRTAVCGQLAADPAAVRRLLEIGVDELSVPVRKVRAVKKLVAELEAGLGLGAEAGPGHAAEGRRGAGWQGTGSKGLAAGDAEADGVAAGTAAATSSRETEAGTAGADAAGAAGDVTVSAPADGELIPMAEIPDEVFASGYLGECFGVLPANGNVYAPVGGVVRVVARTEHSVTIAADDGRNILVHVGIGTARLTEKAFALHVAAGDRVEAGQLIMEADLGVIERAGLSKVIVVVELG